jgi:hypothetical protein
MALRSALVNGGRVLATQAARCAAPRARALSCAKALAAAPKSTSLFSSKPVSGSCVASLHSHSTTDWSLWWRESDNMARDGISHTLAIDARA